MSEMTADENERNAFNDEVSHWQEELRKTSPQELLEAAVHAECFGDIDRIRRLRHESLLRSGFAIGRSGGWRYLAPLSLRNYRKAKADAGS